MKRWMTCIATSVLFCTTFGCSMCCGPYDFDYPTFGGKHERIDRVYGRVGSIFSDPNAQYGIPSDVIDAQGDFQPDGNMEPIDELQNQMESLDELDNIDDAPTPAGGDETTISDRRWRQRPLRRGQHWR